MIIPGQYKARGVKGSAQLGETEKGNLQIALDLDVKDPSGQSLGQMTTFLYFTDGAQAYSYERLRALGWQGQSADDIDRLETIDANEVDVRVTQPEQYRAADGTMKMGQSRIEILTGGGKVTLAKPLDNATFKARLRALSGGGSSAPTNANSPKPPF